MQGHCALRVELSILIMNKKKKVLIIGNNRELNIVSEKIFKRGGFETIVCCDENEARKVHTFEGDGIGCIFYPKKQKKNDLNSNPPLNFDIRQLLLSLTTLYRRGQMRKSIYNFFFINGPYRP